MVCDVLAHPLSKGPKVLPALEISEANCVNKGLND